jgi:hypothetical protein
VTRRQTLLCACALATAAAQPLRLHPANPRYYEFRGRPAVLVTSGEHYGAVLNGQFNQGKYLDTLAKDGLNMTRVFTGVYHEVPGDFGITRNTLAPAPAAYVSPYLKVGAKYDLSKWNPAYWARLKGFVAEASKRGIVVEVVLFCVYYRDAMWNQSPLNAKNNLNQVGDLPRTDVLTLKNAKMVATQEAFARKVADELRGADNVILEICNEPYVRGVEAAPDWQRHIAKAIHGRSLLVAQNIANNTATIADPDPNVSVFNFHYARPPVAVAQNYGLNRVIGLDETGFDGTLDAIYRIQAWDFLAAGGAHYNNLDYSFVVGHEDGSFLVPGNSPGGGSAALRQQLGHLLRVFSTLDFVNMKPADIVMGGVPEGGSARVLAREGKHYLIYLHTGRLLANHRPRYVYRTDRQEGALLVNLPAGRYKVEWWNTRTGKADSTDTFRHEGGRTHLPRAPFTEDTAATVTAIQ